MMAHTVQTPAHTQGHPPLLTPVHLRTPSNTRCPSAASAWQPSTKAKLHAQTRVGPPQGVHAGMNTIRTQATLGPLCSLAWTKKGGLLIRMGQINATDMQLATPSSPGSFRARPCTLVFVFSSPMQHHPVNRHSAKHNPLSLLRATAPQQRDGPQPPCTSIPPEPAPARPFPWGMPPQEPTRPSIPRTGTSYSVPQRRCAVQDCRLYLRCTRTSSMSNSSVLSIMPRLFSTKSSARSPANVEGLGPSLRQSLSG